MMPSVFPPTQTLFSLSKVQPWMELGTLSGSPNDLTRLPAVSNIRIGGACCEVSFSSSVMLRRLTTTMWSCESTHTPPSWPTIQPVGKGLGQEGSTANLGAFCADAARAKPSSIPMNDVLLMFPLLELFEVHGGPDYHASRCPEY